MKKKILSLMLVMVLLVSLITVPAFADTTFTLQGNVVLPGTDTAPTGGLTVTVEYCSDKGTVSTSDDYHLDISVPIAQSTTSAAFSVNVPYTAAGAKFTLGYKITTVSQYWDKGYFALSGMQYHQDGQMIFPEGAIINDLKIIPLRASHISGTVGLPVYSATPSAVEVEVSAKTNGTLTDAKDDFEVKTNKITITNAAISYDLKVPTTVTTAGYIVMYKTSAADYEKQGWYNASGTAITATGAAIVDVSAGNRTGINLTLVKKTVVAPVPDPVTPPAISTYDLNGDGFVNVKDQVLVTRSMGSAKKYVKAYDLNKDGVINVVDLKLIQAQIAKGIAKGKKK